MNATIEPVGVSGVRLRCLRAGVGQTVLFLHTLRTQSEMYAGVLERLDRGAVNAVALDLPGHGHSEAPAVAYSLDYFSRVVSAFLAAHRLQGVTVVGESIGPRSRSSWRPVTTLALVA